MRSMGVIQQLTTNIDNIDEFLPIRLKYPTCMGFANLSDVGRPTYALINNVKVRRWPDISKCTQTRWQHSCHIWPVLLEAGVAIVLNFRKNRSFPLRINQL